MTPRPVSRRHLLLGGGGVAVAGVGGGTFVSYQAARVVLPLAGETVALTGPGERTVVAPGRADLVVPHSRVLHDAEDRDRLLDEERAWVDGCAAWARTTAGDGLHSALLDLRVLSADLPVCVAGWTQRWRYAWPRDVSFVAAALARLGRPDEAAAHLRFLARVQRVDGGFEARYDPWTLRSPDDRAAQLDGAGWVLWAARELRTWAPGRPGLLDPLAPMLARATTRLLGSREPRTGLPAPSSDYWELEEDDLTLGTASVVLAGMRCAADLLPGLGEPALGDRAAHAAEALDSRLRATFGAEGWPRTLGSGAADAAVTFLAPPVGALAGADDLQVSLARSWQATLRPAGGVAPGAAWKEDGISWSPETALYALAWAATGATERATRTLGWLADHRTEAGSYSEKVLHDGRPAAVAPLAWTAALVVLARHELARR